MCQLWNITIRTKYYGTVTIPEPIARNSQDHKPTNRPRNSTLNTMFASTSVYIHKTRFRNVDPG